MKVAALAVIKKHKVIGRRIVDLHAPLMETAPAQVQADKLSITPTPKILAKDSIFFERGDATDYELLLLI